MNFGILNNYIDSNFFAYICTPWQIRSVEVAIRKIRESGKSIKATIFVSDHNTTGRTINMEDCPILDGVYWVNIGFKDFEDAFKTLNVFEKLKAFVLNKNFNETVYFFCPGIINTRWLYFAFFSLKKKAIFILGDDGAGGYLGYGDLIKTNLFKSKIYSFLIDRLYKNNCVINQQLLIKTNERYIRNEAIAKWYEVVLSASGKPLKNEIIEEVSNKIIINTQCIYDNGQIKGEQDLSVLQILYSVLGKYNKDVVIKPHPREVSLSRYNKFGWKVLTGINITQEEIFSKIDVKPKMVIGIYSSTLVNLKALFGVETISLAEFYRNEDVGASEIAICNRFINEFEGLVKIPKTIDELKKYIEDNIIRL